jgi:hypothetical protein
VLSFGAVPAKPKNVAVPALCVAASSGITKDVTVQYIEPHLPIMTGSKNKAQQTTRGEKINKKKHGFTLQHSTSC